MRLAWVVDEKPNGLAEVLIKHLDSQLDHDILSATEAHVDLSIYRYPIIIINQYLGNLNPEFFLGVTKRGPNKDSEKYVLGIRSRVDDSNAVKRYEDAGARFIYLGDIPQSHQNHEFYRLGQTLIND